MKSIKHLYYLFIISIILFFSGRWAELREIWSDLERLTVQEVEVDLYHDLDDDVWK
jgi:hypothetical protein